MLESSFAERVAWVELLALLPRPECIELPFTEGLRTVPSDAQTSQSATAASISGLVVLIDAFQQSLAKAEACASNESRCILLHRALVFS